MRHKLKKEVLDVIIQKISNDPNGSYLEDLLRIAENKRSRNNVSLREYFATAEGKVLVSNTKWLFGYEDKVVETLEEIKAKLEEQIFQKELCHVTIMSCIACYCVLVSIFDAEHDEAKWDELFESCDKKRVLECLEILQRHCPEKINVDGFCDARRYIRIWDSAYNW